MSTTTTQPADVDQEAEFAGRLRLHELRELFWQVDDHGYAVLPTAKLLRLLDKRSRAQGTWKALLEAWEAFGGDRNELCVFQTHWQGNVVLIKGSPASITAMAGE